MGWVLWMRLSRIEERSWQNWRRGSISEQLHLTSFSKPLSFPSLLFGSFCWCPSGLDATCIPRLPICDHDWEGQLHFSVERDKPKVAKLRSRTRAQAQTQVQAVSCLASMVVMMMVMMMMMMIRLTSTTAVLSASMHYLELRK